ncbi:hypothetical protein PCASD_22052 [Puccinia coronata f. sp. avenae]|uniref:Uncharacterized protein n=1 Tax=Puccinia coronata f. sp. avenae TaxID=200324 RepID=A0A2N5SAZ5_9BASI|nr:hypothetical protein PCASD_22052 [Puccinia coronata f. sp. avenae]
MLGFVQVRGSMQKLTLFLNLCIIPALGSLKIKLAEEGTSSRGYFGEGVLNLRKQTESSELLVDRGISSGCFSLDSRVTRVAPEEEHSKSDGSQGTRGHTWETYDPIQSEERRHDKGAEQVGDSRKEEVKKRRKQKKKDKKQKEKGKYGIMIVASDHGKSRTAGDTVPLPTGNMEKKSLDRTHGKNQNDRMMNPQNCVLSKYQPDEARKNFYRSCMKSAFQPLESDRPDEIFPGIIKPLFSHAIHTTECVKLVAEMSSNIHLEQIKKGSSDTSPVHSSMILTALGEVLETHLKTLNPQDHLPISEMDHGLYRKLQVFWNFDKGAFFKIEEILSSKLNKSELHRRLSSLANQIVQKTAVENWKLIRNSLGGKGKNSNKVQAFVRSIQKDFQLDQEFPDTLACFEVWKQNPGIFGRRLNHPRMSSSEFLVVLLGFAEYRRRFGFEIISQKVSYNSLSFAISQPELPLGIWEDLKNAEKTNGVDIWMVCCFIKILGLGKNKQFQEYGDDELVDDFERIFNLIHSERYRHVMWYESPDRAWLTRNYKDYHQKLDRLFREGKSQENSSSSGVSGLNDWNLFYDSCPSEFNDLQKEFIQNWFQGIIGLIKQLFYQGHLAY